MNYKHPIYGNDGLREMTEAEYAEYLKAQAELAKIPKPEPSPDERIAALEEENRQMKEALNALLDGRTEAAT